MDKPLQQSWPLPKHSKPIVIIGAGGIEKILEFKLLPHEQEMLNNTLKAVEKTVAETKL